MEVQVDPEVQAKLEEMSRESGRTSSELVEDALVGYFAELSYTRETLERRLDDVESGRVRPINGDEA